MTRPDDSGGEPPSFDPEAFHALVQWRRDVRRFKTDPLQPGQLDRLLDIADLAPSVGNSQPWRSLEVMPGSAVRAAVRANFEACNQTAALAYDDPQTRDDYSALKLAGFDAAPVHLAVLCDRQSDQGRGLGRQTMPEMLDYSCVAMITTLWYAARTEGVGLGWVSILDARAVTALLDVPASWALVGYLLLGFPLEEHADPELERHGWQQRTPASQRRFKR